MKASKQSKKSKKLPANDPPQDPDPAPGGHEEPLEEGTCLHCFYKPCVTIMWADNVGPGARPSDRNASERKGLYKKFWGMMSNTGGWTKPQYLRKKVALGGRHVVKHRRDIMPKCVLDLCKGRYPNPEGRDYMDHKWE